MKIFYTASYYGKDKYQKEYDMVLKSIKDTDVEIISPEMGNYLNVLTERIVNKLKDKKKIHYEAVRKGIQQAQGIIIEVSNEDFQLGHEATQAIYSKKHVLCLSIHEDFSEKIINPYFHGLKFNQYNVEEAVADFVEMVKKESLGERFNMFLNPKQIDYLKKASEEKGVNKSEYIRMLIDNDRK